MLQIAIEKELHGANGLLNLEIKCDIEQGEFVAIMGKSGSGKTTLLRILAGLEEAQGSIGMNHVTWLGARKPLAVQKRNIGFLFQDYALFENMSVEENLLFVKKDKKFANELLELTELTSLKKESVTRLSGGQKQRVALCRAMMNRPQLLLLDEPLSALDSVMRLKLQDEILKMHRAFGMTSIMVSHDASEIYRLASRVLILENGKIVKDGTPKEVMMENTKGLEGELLALNEQNIATVLLGHQLLEVIFSAQEAKGLKVGQKITLAMRKTL